MELPDVKFGKVSADDLDWRSVANEDDDDDDEELMKTPPDVIAMLGFDPLKP